MPEKTSYDHVGIEAELFPEDGTKIKEKNSKARCTFNASSGLGIKKSGLNMVSCGIIFWSVVVPTLTFGSESWILEVEDIENLMVFQRHVGRRIQRFPNRAHNVNCFYGLWWIRVSTYILIKKILFVFTILKLSDENVIKQEFISRLNNNKDKYNKDKDRCSVNNYRSPIFDISTACVEFGLLSRIVEISKDQKCITSKNALSILV